MAKRSTKTSAEAAPEAARTPSMDKKVVMDLLYHMLLVRRFEEKAAEMYSQGKIGGFLHLAVGMEASCVGAISTLRADDYVIGGYREHGHYLAKGGDPNRAMAELFGRIDGMSKGKGGSMHFFDKARNFLGGTGIVGGQIPIGTGAGLAINYNGGDQVCLVFFGDGSVAQGVFHESLNLASLWRLPVIYVCENNLYAMGTALNRTQAVTDLYKKAEGYGMVGRAGGRHGCPGGARDRGAGGGPCTAREDADPDRVPDLPVSGPLHAGPGGGGVPDPGRSGRVEEIGSDRPLWDRMSREGIISDAEYKDMDKEITQVVEEAVRFSDASPEPPLEELLTDVYV